ncbi:MAG: hypothetical protein K1W22_02645 [Lachnospiraceae bacterium]
MADCRRSCLAAGDVIAAGEIADGSCLAAGDVIAGRPELRRQTVLFGGVGSVGEKYALWKYKRM